MEAALTIPDREAYATGSDAAGMRADPAVARGSELSRVPSLEHALLPVDLNETTGFLVADALSVRFSLFGRRRCLVPAGAIEAIDEGTKVIGLRIQRSAIRGFL